MVEVVGWVGVRGIGLRFGFSGYERWRDGYGDVG